MLAEPADAAAVWGGGAKDWRLAGGDGVDGSGGCPKAVTGLALGTYKITQGDKDLSASVTVRANGSLAFTETGGGSFRISSTAVAAESAVRR